MAWNEPGGSHDKAHRGNRRIDSVLPHDIVDAIPAEPPCHLAAATIVTQ